MPSATPSTPTRLEMPIPDPVMTTATTTTTTNHNRPSSSSTGPAQVVQIDGSEEDAALAKSKFLTRQEVLKRRSRRVRQLARIYRDHYWALMEELKLKYREYYWEYGKSPFQEGINKDNNEDDVKNKKNTAITTADNDNSNFDCVNVYSKCDMNGCKSKAMALTKFCLMHIMSDKKQTLYKTCNYIIKTSQQGPILCGKPILISMVPSLCSSHFQKAEKHVNRALKKAGLNVSSTSKHAPKFHIVIVEYIKQIQIKRRTAAIMAAQRTALENNFSEVTDDNNC